MLLSKKILDYQLYDISGRYDAGWFDSGLEKWLYKEFLFNAFNKDEIDRLEEMNISYQSVSISDDFYQDDEGYENQHYNIYDYVVKIAGVNSAFLTNQYVDKDVGI